MRSSAVSESYSAPSLELTPKCFVRHRIPAHPSVRRWVTMGDMQRSIRFPDDLDARIAKIAEGEDRSFSYVVVRAMERALGDATGDRIPERPAPPRSTSPAKASKRPDTAIQTAHTLPKVERRAKASDAMSAALARQQALNKPKGI